MGYKELFPEVRSYEFFKYLHLGIISEIRRKSLPEIAKVVGLKSAQALHHFIAESSWSVMEIRKRRLSQTLAALKGNTITVVIDKTGDRKKGKRTDYVARQYLGSIGKLDSGIVLVNAYGIYENITFPLLFRVFKPKGTLKEGEKYQTKIEIALDILNEIIEFGFKINLVLADSLYGEASSFIRTLDEYKLPWIVAIRSNHGVWLPLIKGLERINGINFKESLVIKLLKQDTSEKLFLAREVLEAIGKSPLTQRLYPKILRFS